MLGAAGPAVWPFAAAGRARADRNDDEAIHRKNIPGTGVSLPTIGMGTYITFNVGPSAAEREPLAEVLRIFFERGGGMIDSSPMYGQAEAVLGDLLTEMDSTDGLFSATKVWTRSTSTGVEQIDDSLELWDIPRFDLMQVHNLVNWQAHLETMRARRDAGEIRYLGITTSHGRRLDECERIMRNEPLDFVQLTYNVVDRWAEDTLLPLARERGIAVIANRPFQGGRLFDRFADAPLPDWASGMGINNWAQFFLKFIVSHPAVTCAIPATSRPEHMRENMGALSGPIPDAATRKAMIDYLDTL
ncbi:MAG: aldo/keto reductase [Spiribacter salinus]|uniref:Aldo/keto reductase n=1 Tax=Spiribacter salinus TaxID=1335746 RepID=A0A540VSX9_9GAMM|nr:MAG: aldo/keto reductase [Spiribacter salinus]